VRAVFINPVTQQTSKRATKINFKKETLKVRIGKQLIFPIKYSSCGKAKGQYGMIIINVQFTITIWWRALLERIKDH
jgi:hypothetical protein